MKSSRFTQAIRSIISNVGDRGLERLEDHTFGRCPNNRLVPRGESLASSQVPPEKVDLSGGAFRSNIDRLIEYLVGGCA
jgi:hypothetical protein